MEFPRVPIVILNWNGWRDTIECLESLYRITYPSYDVIVVDNNSEDDSIQRILEYCNGDLKVNSMFFEYVDDNKPIKVFELDEDKARKGAFNLNLYEKYESNRRLILIKNMANYGFASGNNIAIRFAMSVFEPRYILLLNNDVVVERNFLGYLVEFAEKDMKVGIVGPKILRKENPNIIDSTGHVFKLGRIVDRGEGEVDRGQYDSETNVVGFMAATVLYRTEMLRSIGLFDEDYFLCYEDAELSWRAYVNGWRAKYVPSAVVYHGKSVSTRKNKETSGFTSEFCTRNVIRTILRHGSATQKMLLVPLLMHYFITYSADWITGKNKLGPIPYLKGFLKLLRER
jgi:hypothetical protein